MLNLRFLYRKPQNRMVDEKPAPGGNGLLYRTIGPHGNGSTIRGGIGPVELGIAVQLRAATRDVAGGVARR